MDTTTATETPISFKAVAHDAAADQHIAASTSRHAECCDAFEQCDWHRNQQAAAAAHRGAAKVERARMGA